MNIRSALIAVALACPGVSALAQFDAPVPPPPPPVTDEPMALPVEGPATGSGPIRVADEQPVFPGGQEALMKHIAANVRYPDEAKETSIEGKVFVEYIVEVDGRIGLVRVVRGVHPALDKAAVDAVKTLPPYTKPAMLNGRAMPFAVMVPVQFKLD